MPRYWGFVELRQCALSAALAATAAAIAVALFLIRSGRLLPAKHETTTEVFESSSFSAPLSSLSLSSTHGLGGMQSSCEESDDLEYSCLLSRPPGAFDDELKLYFAVRHGDFEQQLAVKIVVPRKSLGGNTIEGAWASVGFSPNGKMAGPSEAVIGVAGSSAPGVRRYRMDGYQPSSVTPLPACEQVLRSEAVETTSDGSLVVRFTRPFSLPESLQTPPRADHEGGAKTDKCAGNSSPSVGTCGGIAETESSVVLRWMDPRGKGINVLWAYGSRAPWPSYHEATGSFILPQLV